MGPFLRMFFLLTLIRSGSSDGGSGGRAYVLSRMLPSLTSSPALALAFDFAHESCVRAVTAPSKAKITDCHRLGTILANTLNGCPDTKLFLPRLPLGMIQTTFTVNGSVIPLSVHLTPLAWSGVFFDLRTVRL